MKKLLALAVMLIASGCVGTNTVGGGMTFHIEPDPPQVFSQGVVRINVDMDNENPRDITDVHYNVFDSGRLYADLTKCAADIPMMKPGELKSFFCYMQAPDIDEPAVQTKVSARAFYKTDFSAVQVIEMMSEDEYTRRQANAQVASMPQSYSYGDRNVEMRIDFSDSVPVIVRNAQGTKDYYMYITVRNIGNGFIDRLDADNFKIAPVGKSPDNVVVCPSLEGDWHLDVKGKEFPRIACRLQMPQGVSVVENYGLLISMNYDYEVRTSATVDVVK